MRRFTWRAGFWRTGVAMLVALSATSCGGGGGDLSPSPAPVAQASNVVPVIVDAGPDGNAVNTLYTSVTVCVPGSTVKCQTIDHIQVDTASYGLRILAPVLTLALPTEAATDTNALVECTGFADGYSWGSVALADVQISGESASQVPIQVIGDNAFAVPADCSGTGKPEDTVDTFGANGILGIGVFAEDCGTTCADSAANGLYYSCTLAACAPIAVPLAAQVLNPIPLFDADNNGSILSIPTVPTAGEATVTGSLIFGIDTESNNASGTQTVLTVDSDFGDFTTTYKGETLDSSFLDTGSNGYFFNDDSISECSSGQFYCPANTLSLSGTMTGVNGVSIAVPFSIDNAQTIENANPTFTAFPTLGGTFPGTMAGDTFDWGLPFYFGRRVSTAIEGSATAVATGPYVAF